MTKEYWVEVERRLNVVGRHVHLQCDQFRLTLVRSRKTKMTDCIVFFVDGHFGGGILTADCDERRRFCRPVSRRVYPRKLLQRISKKALKRFGIDWDKKYTSYSTIWLSFSRLKAHLIRNNKEITWIREVE